MDEVMEQWIQELLEEELGIQLHPIPADKQLKRVLEADLVQRAYKGGG
jgi:hypothetical protein